MCSSAIQTVASVALLLSVLVSSQVTNVSCSTEFITVGYHLSSSFYLPSDREVFFSEATGNCIRPAGYSCAVSTFPWSRQLCQAVSTTESVELAYVPTFQLSQAVLSQFTNFTQGTLRYVYVGAFDNFTNGNGGLGTWYWVNGKPLNINDSIWASGQPDNNDVSAGSQSDCGGIAKSYYLADYTCASTQGLSFFLCEVTSEIL
jgi:hypothetical protein